MLEIGGHRFPEIDKKLETWYDSPDSRYALTRESLLNI